ELPCCANAAAESARADAAPIIRVRNIGILSCLVWAPQVVRGPTGYISHLPRLRLVGFGQRVVRGRPVGPRPERGGEPSTFEELRCGSSHARLVTASASSAGMTAPLVMQEREAQRRQRVQRLLRERTERYRQAIHSAVGKAEGRSAADGTGGSLVNYRS